MNKLKLGYIPPSNKGFWEPQIDVIIDDINLFSFEALEGRFEGVMIRDFFSHDYNNDCLSGRYNLGWSGPLREMDDSWSYEYEASLGDLFVEVATKNNESTF